MFGYDIIYPEDLGYTTKYVDNIFSTISKIVEKRQSGTINIVFLDDESIKNLNNNYRQKDSYTDVLSFHYFDDF
ncbi:MAG: rRNA maturation RNAse YbeY [Candidatus Peribacteria bacterium]|nr:MAG: rRNA maturation RNAse YbeY [Candidatus Peribacteria bacterium]